VQLAVIAASIMASATFLIGILFPQEIIGLFTTDPDLLREASNALRIVILASFLVGFQITGSSMFQALGKAKASLILSLSRQVLFLLPLLMILPHFFHLKGIWISFPVSDILSFLITARLFFRQYQILKP